jgi:hypothetical protein
VDFLAGRQLAHGEFACFRHPDPSLAGEGVLDSSPFVTTFVLHALELVSHPAKESMRGRAFAFLEAEREPPGVWRYWTSRQGSVIDHDLDDTACASFALRDRSKQDNLEVILANRHESGLFKTWLRPPDADNDVDGVVNANVLLYLGERPETTAARDIVTAAINDGREQAASVYYVEPAALYHAVARAHAHGVTGFVRCRDAVADKLGGAGEDPLASALSLCALADFAIDRPAERRRRLEALLARQSADGSWPRAAFYAGPEPPAPHAVWWGSEELTTSLCIAALARSAAA